MSMTFAIRGGSLKPRRLLDLRRPSTFALLVALTFDGLLLLFIVVCSLIGLSGI